MPAEAFITLAKANGKRNGKRPDAHKEDNKHAVRTSSSARGALACLAVGKHTPASIPDLWQPGLIQHSLADGWLAHFVLTHDRHASGSRHTHYGMKRVRTPFVMCQGAKSVTCCRMTSSGEASSAESYGCRRGALVASFGILKRLSLENRPIFGMRAHV